MRPRRSHPFRPAASRHDSSRRRRALLLESLEARIVLTGGSPDLWAPELVPPAALTALLPDGVTLDELLNTGPEDSEEDLITSGEAKVSDVWSSPPRGPNALITVGETEFNDTPAAANGVPLGFNGGEDFAVDVNGSLIFDLAAGAQNIDGAGWNLNANGNIASSTAVPHVTILGTGDGTFDYYSFTVANAGDVGIFDIDFGYGGSGSMDTELFLYDSAGILLRSNDNSSTFNGGGGSISGLDSFIQYTFAAPGTYIIGVGEYNSFSIGGRIGGNTPDPGDTYTLQVSIQNHSLNLAGVDPLPEVEPNQGGDVDYFSMDLEPGDIFGANVTGGGEHITFYSPGGTELIGSGQDLTFIHPPSSPLPGGGNAALSYVVDTAGTYTIAVDQGTGDYTLQLRVYRPELETQRRENRQALFLDFDGAAINAQQIFGIGNADANLSPLSSFLSGWGLSGSDEDAVIDSVVATVVDAFADVGLLGYNGDFDSDGIDGHFGISILNSRDHADPWGDPNVSRVIVGGSIPELGIGTLGIAQSIDVGNFETEETAVVLLDILSGPSGLDSINTIPRASGVSIIEPIGKVVGNITAHEAGHFFANWHTSRFNTVPNIMDQGGNGVRDEAGVGADGIFGTGDDIEVNFGVDVYTPNEGFTGNEDTLNSIAFGLSTGSFDPGQIVTASDPADSAVVLGAAPTTYVLDVLDPVDPATVQASDLTVNGTPADFVAISDGDERLTFTFTNDPAFQGPGNLMEVAADAFTRISDNDGVEAFTASFRYDEILLEPVAVDPADGSIVEQPLTGLTVDFNEAYGQGSISTNDLILSIGTVTGFNFVDDDTVEYTVDLPVVEGPFSVTMPDGAVSDAFGNPGLGFSADYVLDFGSVPYPVPLTPKEPLGSLIYDPSISGNLSGTVLDADSFESGALGGQWSTFSSVLPFVNSLTVADNLVSGALPSITFSDTIDQADFIDPTGGAIGNWLFNNPVPGPGGDDYVVVTTGTLQVNQAGTFSFALSGDDGGRLRIDGADVIVDDSLHGFLNRFGEATLTAGTHTFEWVGFERGGGSAFELAVAVGGGKSGPVTSANGWQVVGDPSPFAEIGLDGPMTATTYYASGVAAAQGRIQVSDAFGAASGNFALLMDTSPSGPLVINEAVWTVDLSGRQQAVLSFAHADFNDEETIFRRLLEPFAGQYRADGVSISNDGVTWVPVFNAPNQSFGVWQDYSLDLSAIAQQTGLTLDDSDFFIKFQQYDNFPLTADGRGWDDIAIEVSSGDTDSFTIDVDPGQTISVLVNGDDRLQASVDLYEGNTLVGSATAVGKGENAVIQTYRVPAQLAQNGPPARTYRLEVSGANQTFGDYTAQVVVNAAVENESSGASANDDLASSQDVGASFLPLHSATPVADGSPQPMRGAVLGEIRETTVTVPGTLENSDGNGGNAWPFHIGNFGQPSMRYQQIYSASEFDLNGLIDELRFRRNGGAFSTTGIDLQISLGYAATTVATASATFADNIGAGYVTVFDGLLDLSSFGSGSPNPFDIVIDVDDVFDYVPSQGDLLLDIRMRNAPVTTFFDASSSTQQSTTTRIYSFPGDVDAPSGRVGFTLGNPRPYGLVTQFGFVPDEDVYSFNLRTGQSATVAATTLSGGDVNIELLDSAGNVVATGGASATNVDSLVQNFVAPAEGTYFVRASGDEGTNYSLLATRNAEFDIEDNNSIDTAQPILTPQTAGAQWVLGHVAGDGSSSIEEIENFDDGDIGDYIFLGSRNVAVTAAAAHDGPFGLETRAFTNWMYRNDIQVQQGDTISVWVNSASFVSGRAYFAFGASAAGTYSMVMAPNSGNLLLQRNAGFGFADIAASPQNWIANKWYRFEVLWDASGDITGNLYDSDGTTLLNTVSANDNTFTQGGIGFRAIGSPKLWDTVTVGSESTTDYFEVTLSEGQPLFAATRTPSAKSGEFLNQLDPMIRVYDAAGNLVASDDNSASDRRNARVSYMVPQGGAGTYFVEVASSSSTAELTAGEYILSIEGNTNQVGSSNLLVEGHETIAGFVPASLTRETVAPFVTGAINYWSQAGVGTAQLVTLQQAEFYVTDLPDASLGTAYSNGRVYLDTNAAGYGWSLGTGDSQGGVDLLATLTHEIGHLLGFEHDDAAEHTVMAASLAPASYLGLSGNTHPDYHGPTNSFEDLLSLDAQVNRTSTAVDLLQSGSRHDEFRQPADSITDDELLLLQADRLRDADRDYWAEYGEVRDESSDDEELLELLAARWLGG